MKIEEAIEKINDFLKVKEIAFFVLEKDSIHIELKKSELEAIRILMTKFEQLQKENEELRKLEKDHNYSSQVIRENTKLRYELAHSISTDKLEEKIKELKSKLKETSNRRDLAKEQEEQAVLWCIEIRLDERIKTLQELLKE